MSHSDVNSKCILCQASVNEVDSPGRMSSVYSEWDKSCAASVCQILKLDADPFQNVFLVAGYCSQCHKLIRDIDFTLNSLNRLQQKLNNSRASVEALLRENYQKVKRCEELSKQDPLGGLDSESLNSDSSSWEKSYCGTVKLIYETLVPVPCMPPPIAKSNIVDESSIGIQKKSRKQKLPANCDEGIIFELGDENITAEATSPKRSRVLSSEREPSFAGVNESYVDEDIVRVFGQEIITITHGASSLKRPDPVPIEPKLSYTSTKPKLSRSMPKKRKLAKSNSENEMHKSKKKQSTGRKVSRATRKKSKHRPGRYKKYYEKYYKYQKKKCTFDGECTYTVHSPIVLQAHINRAHKGDKQPYHCEVCKKKSKGRKVYAFSSMSRYNNHINRHHNNRFHRVTPSKFKCTFDDQCTFTANSLISKEAHINRVHKGDKRPFHCEDCKDASKERNEYTFLSLLGYRKHILNSHRNVPNKVSLYTKCTFAEGCTFKALSSVSMQGHIKGVHQGDKEPFHCEVCKKASKERTDYAFTSLRPYNTHMYRFHGYGYTNKSYKLKKVGRSKIKCTFDDECTFKCIASTTMQEHINGYHKGDKQPIHCEPCKEASKERNDYAFKDYKAYLNHRNKYHSKNPNKGIYIKLKCTFDDQCTFTALVQSSMQAHINGVHKGDTHPYHCEICKEASKERNDYAFDNLQRYFYHKYKYHSGKTPNIIKEGQGLFGLTRIKCTFDEECTYTAVVPSSIQAHVRGVHNGDKQPFHCEACKEASKERNEYAFETLQSYFRHKYKYHSKKQGDRVNQTKIKCTFDDECTFTAIVPLTMESHVNEVHKGDKQPFHCEICKEASLERHDYAFESRQRYNYHFSNYHTNKKSNSLTRSRLKCNFGDGCTFRTEKPNSMRSHLNRVHKGGEKKLLECEICKETSKDGSEYSFESSHSYYTHMYNHLRQTGCNNSATTGTPGMKDEC